VNKSELIAAAADGSGLSKAQVSSALDAILEAVQGAVAAGEKVSITNFGTFERRERAARQGRNPQTGKPVSVPASKAPAFKPGKPFKDRVNG
jgi:DNA-binding protein HU-beta